MDFKPQRTVPKKVRLVLLKLFSAIALIFEGYNQVVMGLVSGFAGYIETRGIGAHGKVTDTTKQGGLVVVYYLKVMFNCFIGGNFGEKFGRQNAVVLGSRFTLLGDGLRAGSHRFGRIQLRVTTVGALLLPGDRRRLFGASEPFFSSSSPIASANEKECRRMLDEAEGYFAVAERGMMKEAAGARSVGEETESSKDEYQIESKPG